MNPGAVCQDAKLFKVSVLSLRRNESGGKRPNWFRSFN